MRLIDADELKQTILENKLMSREPAAKRILEMIDEATTAYDPEAVVLLN